LREFVLAVDLGATKILLGIGPKDGTILSKKRLLTPSGDPAQVLDAIVNGASQLMQDCGVSDKEITGIAVATPGPLAYPEGIVRDSPNLNWKRVELKKELSQRWGRPVIVEKDTNMAVLGEYYYGHYAKSNHLLYITVSTGIGGGIVANGQLYRGNIGGAGEVGHMVIDPGGRKCGCGRQGCLEALASGSAISQQLDEIINQGQGLAILACTPPGQKPSARELGIAAREGDREASLLIAKIAEYLGIGVANLVNIFSPGAVIFGGGVILGLKDLLLTPVRDYVYKNVFALNREELVIDCTELGNDIVLYGCLAAVNKNYV